MYLMLYLVVHSSKISPYIQCVVPYVSTYKPMGYKIGRWIKVGGGLIHRILKWLDFKFQVFVKRQDEPLPEHGLMDEYSKKLKINQ